ncbi:YjdF family protein [uncultured Sphaerochaeta sp.]|uniref:YjdF family protein n=1 Tax=uncultured Sphaerochaeta sp. TaxID=886478 RepID=UPI002A0A3ED2|nr:YjdF family protein [uncultured Sphaerochaeta sp.]
MERIEGSCTVYFDAPFWVGVFECSYMGTYQVARVVFGAEPTPQEFLDFLVNQYDRIHFSTPLEVQNISPDTKMNVKRAIRKVKKETVKGIGTASQLALKKQREEIAVTRKASNKVRREGQLERKFLLRQEKRKEAKRGK